MTDGVVTDGGVQEMSDGYAMCLVDCMGGGPLESRRGCIRTQSNYGCRLAGLKERMGGDN